MISISNADRDKAVEFLRAYASDLQEHGMRGLKQINARRIALILAKKLENKEPHPKQSGPDTKLPQSEK